ncbi:hypothetical protein ALMP_13990 [Streptomyces sp. A012304]|nr:hypothetical protein ALMP_13990 [Streptomyces sp. A012304]
MRGSGAGSDMEVSLVGAGHTGSNQRVRAHPQHSVTGLPQVQGREAKNLALSTTSRRRSSAACFADEANRWLALADAPIRLTGLVRQATTYSPSSTSSTPTDPTPSSRPYPNSPIFHDAHCSLNVPGSRVDHWPGVGHNLHEEHAERATQLIGQWADSA